MPVIQKGDHNSVDYNHISSHSGDVRHGSLYPKGDEEDIKGHQHYKKSEREYIHRTHTAHTLIKRNEKK